MSAAIARICGDGKVDGTVIRSSLLWMFDERGVEAVCTSRHRQAMAGKGVMPCVSVFMLQCIIDLNCMRYSYVVNIILCINAHDKILKKRI